MYPFWRVVKRLTIHLQDFNLFMLFYSDRMQLSSSYQSNDRKYDHCDGSVEVKGSLDKTRDCWTLSRRTTDRWPDRPSKPGRMKTIQNFTSNQWTEFKTKQNKNFNLKNLSIEYAFKNLSIYLFIHIYINLKSLYYNLRCNFEDNRYRLYSIQHNHIIFMRR